MRDKSTIKLLNLYNERPDYENMHKQKLDTAKVMPDWKWFGNVRTIDQKALDKYKSEIADIQKNPYDFLLKKKKIDLQVFTKEQKWDKNKLTDIEPFEEIFGPNMKRNKPKIQDSNLEEYLQRVSEKQESYNLEKDSNLYSKKVEQQNYKKFNENKKIQAGQSKWIWEELYKVIDSSDVLCMVLDARDPLGTKCAHAEEAVKQKSQFKHIIYVLNKIDLVPKEVTVKWVKYLSQFHPTVTFKSGISNNFGRMSLINILRQFDQFHKDKKTISVGFIGYPNVGKSSIINSLKQTACCKAAPIAGETKVWQYVALTSRIYLIDCPGIVYSDENDSSTDVVLKGVVRPERLVDPDFFVEEITKRVPQKVLMSIYKIEAWTDTQDFLKKVAIRFGRLLKQNEPDIMGISLKILNDWQRGGIPHFELPPKNEKKD